MAQSDNANSMLRPKATEERLDEIRREAAARGEIPVVAGGASSIAPLVARSPKNDAAESYYNLPVLKEPTWTWEVPLYFFLGGVAGVSSCIALAAQFFHGDPALIRAALWMALAGAAICPILLISDLGRPSRFLNMLRVFKIQSPMSVGAWTLVTFSGCAFLAVLGNELVLRGFSSPLFFVMLWTGEVSAAVTGLILASYTGVLVGATAIPVWSENRKLLPPHFLTSGLGSAAGILELLGFLTPAMQILGFMSAGIETLIGGSIELRRRNVDIPLHHGKSGWFMRIAGTLEGPVALLLRIIWHSSPIGRYAAASCFIVGAVASRFAWIWAGRVSARDPHALLQLQTGKANSSQPA